VPSEQFNAANMKYKSFLGRIDVLKAKKGQQMEFLEILIFEVIMNKVFGIQKSLTFLRKSH
jgi:hypothetical protein